MTGIQWTDAVWNPTTGCDQVSPGCDNCYALTMAKRLKGMGQAKYQNDGDPRTSGPGFGITEHPDALLVPLRWRKPRRVFVNSMSDLFHAGVSDEFIAKVWATMAQTPRHTYQILTKRPARMRAWLRRCAPWDGYVTHNGRAPGAYNDGPDSGVIVGYLPSTVTKHHGVRTKGGPRSEVRQVGSWPLANVWLGVSVESQRWADIRIPALLDTPAAVRWLSCEPLLSGLDLGLAAGRIDWIVVGGESGSGAGPMSLDWVRSLRDQCQEASVPIFVKQLGSVWASEHGGPRKGGDPVHWPADLRVRDYPAVPDA